MRILHVNTYSGGGAARAAIRLHEGLLKINVNSHFLFLEIKQKRPTSNFSVYKQQGKFVKKVNRKIFSLKYPQKKHFDFVKHHHKDRFEWISFPFSLFNIAKVANNYDLVNIHWVADFLDYTSFFREIQVPVVWTLHDMNPFSGVLHYNMDLYSNSDILSSLEEWSTKQKKRAISKLKTSLDVVCPSRWIQTEAQKSWLLGEFNTHHIPYGVDLNAFKPLNKRDAKEKLKVDPFKPCILMVADNLKIKRKGADFFLNLVTDPDLANFQFLTVGDNKIEHDHVINLGRINSNEQLALVYSAADVFVLTSRMDNLPNTILESMACGTPVVAFKVGGMVDLIIPGNNGQLVAPFSKDELKERILEIISDDEISKKYNVNARNFIENYSLENQANQYKRLYSQLLNK